jgi:hypothetical protein
MFFCHDEQRGGEGEGGHYPPLGTVLLPRRAARARGGVITSPYVWFFHDAGERERWGVIIPPSILFFCHNEQRGGGGGHPALLGTVFLPRRAARGKGGSLPPLVMNFLPRRAARGRRGGGHPLPRYSFSATTAAQGRGLGEGNIFLPR